MSDIRQRALGLLARREHSARELITKLIMRDYDEATVQSVVATLAKEGLQSDDRFAEGYIHGRIEKGYGPVRIKQELRGHGINDDLIYFHLDMHAPEWEMRAIRAREKRFGKKIPQDFNDKAKQMRFLQQRGFSGEQMRKFLELLINKR